MSLELVHLIHDRSAPLEPVATAEAPVLPRITAIRAVVFDVYGTLFISGSGDISLARAENRSPALAASLREAGWSVDAEAETGLADSFHTVLEGLREARSREGFDWPEVRIEEVWEQYIRQLEAKAHLSGKGSVEKAVVAYECRVNPCWPMPGLREVLSTICGLKQALGIVSNAQFYTPLLFPALTGMDLQGHGFDPDLCIWSYRERIGKPDTALYEKLAGRLAARSIQPREVLYVGNDLRNDIRPARDTGFRTVLFAGDKRSLRWRRDDPECRNVHPDATVTHLEQIPGLLGHAS